MVNVKRSLFFVVFLLALAGCAAPRRAQAQFIGYVSPQTEQQTLATSQTCTGANQIFLISNLGQTQHYLQIGSVTGATIFTAQLQGLDGQGNSYPISDLLLFPSGAPGLTLKGTGAWPALRAVINCQPNTATFSANYSGGWGTTDVNAGTYLTAQLEKAVFVSALANANQALTFRTPFGLSGGQIAFSYTVGAAGGSVQVSCASSNGAFTQQIANFPLANSSTLQTFQVTDLPCTSINVQYTNSGAGGTFTLTYVFGQPGRASPPANAYSHITTTTAAAVKAGPGFLHTVVINTSAAGTLSIFDLASASCTGTPATNVVAVITAAASPAPVSFPYDVNLLNGICVKTSVAMDVTVTFQ